MLEGHPWHRTTAQLALVYAVVRLTVKRRIRRAAFEEVFDGNEEDRAGARSIRPARCHGFGQAICTPKDSAITWPGSIPVSEGLRTRRT